MRGFHSRSCARSRHWPSVPGFDPGTRTAAQAARPAAARMAAPQSAMPRSSWPCLFVSYSEGFGDTLLFDLKILFTERDLARKPGERARIRSCSFLLLEK